MFVVYTLRLYIFEKVEKNGTARKLIKTYYNRFSILLCDAIHNPKFLLYHNVHYNNL